MKFWLVFVFSLIGIVAATEVALRSSNEQSHQAKKAPRLKDLAPPEGEYKAIKIERIPASAPIIDPHQSKVYFYGGCRDSYGRTYGPNDEGYQSCMNGEKPHDSHGPFAKRKALGIGILIDD